MGFNWLVQRRDRRPGARLMGLSSGALVGALLVCVQPAGALDTPSAEGPQPGASRDDLDVRVMAVLDSIEPHTTLKDTMEAFSRQLGNLERYIESFAYAPLNPIEKVKAEWISHVSREWTRLSGPEPIRLAFGGDPQRTPQELVPHFLFAVTDLAATMSTTTATLSEIVGQLDEIVPVEANNAHLHTELGKLDTVIASSKHALAETLVTFDRLHAAVRHIGDAVPHGEFASHAGLEDPTLHGKLLLLLLHTQLDQKAEERRNRVSDLRKLREMLVGKLVHLSESYRTQRNALLIRRNRIVHHMRRDATKQVHPTVRRIRAMP